MLRFLLLCFAFLSVARADDHKIAREGTTAFVIVTPSKPIPEETTAAGWLATPGAWADEYSPLLTFVCGRIAQAELGGLVLTGQNGNNFPAHELNYLALEYFSWHPERTYDQFIADRLAPSYGGKEHAALFLKMLRDTSKSPADLKSLHAQTIEVGKASDLDIRQRARWTNLAQELARREKLAEASRQRIPREPEQLRHWLPLRHASTWIMSGRNLRRHHAWSFRPMAVSRSP